MIHRCLGGGLVALLGLLWAGGLLRPAGAAAQAPRQDSVRSAVFELERGTTIRLSSDRGVVEGTLTRVDGDGLVLGPDPHVYGLAAVDTLWVRGRATRKGALIGGIAGGVGGGLFGGFLGLVSEALCEYECPDGDFLHYAGWVAGTGLVGTIGGAGLGALIGSAFPRWHRKYP